MKRFAIFLLILFIGSICFSATSRLYDGDSWEYQSVRKLCMLSGSLGPSNASPMTENELYSAFLQINPSKLNERNYEEYLELQRIFSDVEPYFDLKGSINPFFYKTGIQDELDNEEFLMPYNEMPFIFNYGLEASFEDYGYLELIMDEGNDEFIEIFDENGNKISEGKFVYDSSFDYLLKKQNGNWYSLFSDLRPVTKYSFPPSIARGAISNGQISLIMGRTKQYFGAGYTGNIIISDNFRYQEMLQLAFNNSKFNYRLNITHFDTQDSNGDYGDSIFSGYQTNRIVHRLEFKPSTAYRGAINFGLMMCADNGFDIRFLVPMMFVHNWYNFNETIDINSSDEGNNALVLEIEAMPITGLRLTGQFMLDQISQRGETTAVVPNAFGGLINVTYIENYTNFDVEYFIEGFYSNHNLYLNKKRNGEIVDWNRDWIVGYSRVVGGDIQYSGHPYGPDTIMVAAGTYFDFTRINVKVKNIVEWKKSGEQAKNKNTEFIMDGKTPSGIAETRISIRSYNEWRATDNLDVLLNLGISFYKNFEYEVGIEKTIPQLAFGIKWELL